MQVGIRFLLTQAVKIDHSINLHLAACQPLFETAIERRETRHLGGTW